MAIGSDVQWQRLTASAKFAGVANEVRKTNEGRHREREAIHRDMAAVTSRHVMDDILADLRAATIPATRILDIRQVRELPQIREKLTRTAMPDARVVHMQPMAVDLEDGCAELAFPPRYGADTRHVLAEAGYLGADMDALAGAGVIA
jgi:crotonobetainyl-CoA:carnitine CoA-transferase CaiB-like acyl-CoA transferase